LPLENLSGDSGEEYFVDGMTDALIANLGNIEALRVVSRTSIMRYKGSQKALPDIARELKVDGIVEGSVLRVGQRVRINAQLIHAPDDRHLWGESYERDLRDILSLQNEIARSIASEIEVSVTPRERARLSTGRSIDPEAYHLHLKGRYHWNRRTEQDLLRSVEYFQKAIEKDPDYALAHAGLADAYNILGNWSVLRADEAFPRAKDAATKALNIDPTLAEAEVALTFARFLFDHDWSGTDRGFRRAIELNPNYAPGHQWYAVYLAAAGDAERAVREARRAAELDPLSLIINSVVGWVMYLTRQYDASIQQCVDVLNMDPNFHPALLYVGEAYDQKRSFAKAIDALEAARRLEERPRVLGALGHAYAVARRTKDAMAVLDELDRLSASRPVAFEGGLIYSGLGEVDRALASLEQAADERYPWLVLADVEPRLDPLRGHARFTALLKRIRIVGRARPQ
jgi:TolB-like protein/Tfp pilus assembly protein PilF